MMCKFECTHFRVALSWPLYANMTSSTKPEVNNVSHRRHGPIDGQVTWITKSSASADGPRDALSVEILSTAAQLYSNTLYNKATTNRSSSA